MDTKGGNSDRNLLNDLGGRDGSLGYGGEKRMALENHYGMEPIKFSDKWNQSDFWDFTNGIC